MGQGVKLTREVEPFEVHSAAGAGILTYCVSNDGTTYVVLGKERHVSNWRGSLSWSSFAGGRKGLESPAETAAREFAEETLGVIPLDSSEEVGVLWNKRMTSRHLNAQKYDYRICMRMHKGSEQHCHVTYVQRIPWIPHLCEKFAMVRRALNEVLEVSNRLGFMADSIPYRYPFIREGMSIVYKGRQYQVTSLTSVAVSGGCLQLSFEYEDADGVHAAMVQSVDEDEKAMETYLEWFNYRKKATLFLRRIEADINLDAIYAEFNAHGTLVTLRVIDDFMEKKEIRMWNIAELRETLQFGGSFRNQKFRAYFLPLLQVSLEVLDRSAPRDRDTTEA